MENRFLKNGELNDSKIMMALDEAVESWADGEITETRDILAEIVSAIDEFDNNYEL